MDGKKKKKDPTSVSMHGGVERLFCTSEAMTGSATVVLTADAECPSVAVVGAALVAENLPAHSAVVATPEHGERRVAAVAHLTELILMFRSQAHPRTHDVAENK